MGNLLTLPCDAHQSGQWYAKKPASTTRPRYVHDPHRPSLRRHYAEQLSERRRKEYLQALAAFLADEQSEISPRAREAEFRALVARWLEETKTISSTTDRALHTAYQDIIGMGEPAVPLILREMAANGGHWFWALRHITHENPVSPRDAGNIQKMREVWLQWGQDRHYL